MAAHVVPGPVFQYAPPRQVFSGVFNLRAESGVSYDVEPKGNRFLMIRPAADATGFAAIRVITNWSGELERVMAKQTP
jgi:hypothetical protein